VRIVWWVGRGVFFVGVVSGCGFGVGCWLGCCGLVGVGWGWGVVLCVMRMVCDIV